LAADFYELCPGQVILKKKVSEILLTRTRTIIRRKVTKNGEKGLLKAYDRKEGKGDTRNQGKQSIKVILERMMNFIRRELGLISSPAALLLRFELLNAPDLEICLRSLLSRIYSYILRPVTFLGIDSQNAVDR
jgi:hypothetical protein